MRYMTVVSLEMSDEPKITGILFPISMEFIIFALKFTDTKR
ncbi:hypothetical protein HMPREF0645_0037 [Hallella bergensis DSM 17361]|uniref:Uncharacterized protein n=1 Tax=Hallella bergensis DSM 17361 TaxID=585502 RepID=D1PSX8_9BACT|nr:hypothetical protein HMPREF0645_0037 [Hallella bergensis DSM 17361]